MGFGKTAKVNMTVDELNTLLTGNTDNGRADTIPEIVEALGNGGGSGGGGTCDMEPMSISDIDDLLNT